jgi:hypothetical protein
VYWQTANGKRQTANGKRQTANGKRQTANGKRQEKKPTSEGGRYKGREDRRSNVKPMMAI